jgi:hypothetical protein
MTVSAMSSIIAIIVFSMASVVAILCGGCGGVLLIELYYMGGQ